MIYNVYSQSRVLGLLGKVTVPAAQYNERFNLARKKYPLCRGGAPVLEQVDEGGKVLQFRRDYGNGD